MALTALIDRLRLPEASQLAHLDDPGNVAVLRQIILRKPYLRKIYLSFYCDMLRRIQATPRAGLQVELGSGAGFIKSVAPAITTSDVLPYDGIDLTFSALEMPFADRSLSALVMIDVLHHLKDSHQFFAEVRRCLMVGGRVVMIEPANTAWSRWIYTRFHHEPFEPDGGWGFEAGGPLSGANMAIPWIVFCRDRQQFIQTYPDLAIRAVVPHTPLRYLISGGLSLQQLLPSWTYPLVLLLEWLLTPIHAAVGMFMTIEIEKVE